MTDFKELLQNTPKVSWKLSFSTLIKPSNNNGFDGLTLSSEDNASVCIISSSLLYLKLNSSTGS